MHVTDLYSEPGIDWMRLSSGDDVRLSLSDGY